MPKKQKAVILLSTMHATSEIDSTTGEKKKPSMITFYNKTKGGVDTADKKCAATSCARRTRRWPLACFYSLLNKTCLNAYVIYLWNNPSCRAKRRDFLRELGKESVKEQVANRLANQRGIQTDLRAAIQLTAKRLGICSREEGAAEAATSEPQAAGPKHQGRCHMCPRSADKKTRKTCSLCGKHACSTHMVEVCLNCRNN